MTYFDVEIFCITQNVIQLKIWWASNTFACLASSFFVVIIGCTALFCSRSIAFVADICCRRWSHMCETMASHHTQILYLHLFLFLQHLVCRQNLASYVKCIRCAHIKHAHSHTNHRTVWTSEIGSRRKLGRKLMFRMKMYMQLDSTRKKKYQFYDDISETIVLRVPSDLPQASQHTFLNCQNCRSASEVRLRNMCTVNKW